jgi:hypothetical protein
MAKEDDIFGIPAPAREVNESPVDKARFCAACGAEARIVSNRLGRTAFCGPCGTSWPISGPVVPPHAEAAYLPRGLSKQTLLEPDYSMAYEDDEEDQLYETKRWEEEGDDESSS